MNFIKKIGISSMALMLSVSAFAQDYGIKAGDKIISLNLGSKVNYGYVSEYDVNRTVNNYDNTGYLSQPTYISSYTNDVSNAIGVEFKYFVTSQIAVRLSGAGMISSAPSQDYIEGIDDLTGSNDPSASVPSYAMTEGRNTQNYYVDLGADYYFVTGIDRLNPYIGIQGNFIYGSLELTDGYRGLDDNGEVLPTYDTRQGESYGFGGSLVGGVDYYLAPGFFLGVEIKAASYLQTTKNIYHQTGLEAQSTYSHNTSFLTQPLIKVGFKF
ncbi:BT1926 family outer membrane beta-barrel protein [Saccharicrinis aurantiacus]|uniref:BT1926 family outer membrane beta-barrel protein n=1 Tax=Saccharicrinis aurantiacus TaxID=1849719 RepID=UPI00094F754F|nr:BT1926 family outer membrane beta-barrel protein [Saccharicrinis aurantiacus]